MQPGSASVIAFWFDGVEHDPVAAMARNEWWYGGGTQLDALITQRFGATVERARRGGCDSWAEAAHGALALVIVLDQFPRNIWRGTAQSFACDEQALACARAALLAGFMEALTPAEQAFLLMPFQHAESLNVQRESVALFERLREQCEPQWRKFADGALDYARQHLAIVERFGRFPHRNALLDRRATAAEEEYLAEGGATFGTQ